MVSFMKRYTFSLGILLLFAVFLGISLSTARTGIDKKTESSSLFRAKQGAMGGRFFLSFGLAW